MRRSHDVPMHSSRVSRRKLSKRQRHAADGLRTAALGARELRAEALRVITELGETEGGVWYTLSQTQGRVAVSDWEGRAFDGWMIEPLTSGEVTWPEGDPHRPRNRELRSFVTLQELVSDWDAYYSSRFYERAFGPAKVKDQLRLLVYDGAEFVGWIGGFRYTGSPAFRRSDARRLAPLVEPIANCLVTAHRLDRADRIEEACDLLVDADGRVDFTSESGKRWLSRSGATEILRGWVRSIDRGDAPRQRMGWQIRWNRLYGDGRVRYLVHLRAPSPVLVRPLDRLSPARREVAQLAAAGATLSEIAKMTERSRETVKSQLKAVYRELGVASRAELGRVLAQ